MKLFGVVPFVGAPPTAVTAVYVPVVVVHVPVQCSTKYPATFCPAVVGMMSQLRLTCALPTTASSAVTVLAGPADATEKLLVPAGVIAATRYWNEEPGNIAVVPSTQAVIAEQENPETAPVTNGAEPVEVPSEVHVSPLSALRSMV